MQSSFIYKIYLTPPKWDVFYWVLRADMLMSKLQFLPLGITQGSREIRRVRLQITTIQGT